MKSHSRKSRFDPADAHDHRTDGRRLMVSLAFTAAFAVVEALGGWLSGSLALLSDAGHMVTDSSALALGALAAWMARKPPSGRHSYGLQRAEVIGALVNALLMVAVVVAIFMAALERLRAPPPVNGTAVIVIALAGLAVNTAVAWILARGARTLNVRAALLHVLADLLGSAGALAAGLVIYYTGWLAADPILSMGISVLILLSSFGLLRDVTHVLLEGVPREVDYDAVGKAMAGISGVIEVHDLHIWTLSSASFSLSAHVRIADMADWPDALDRLSVLLSRDFGIEHVTLQPEPHTRVLPLPPASRVRNDGRA